VLQSADGSQRARSGSHGGRLVKGDLVGGRVGESSSVDEPVSGERGVEGVGADNVRVDHDDGVSLGSVVWTRGEGQGAKKALTLLVLMSLAPAAGRIAREGAVLTSGDGQSHRQTSFDIPL
jgi:hypothetical protein